MLQTAESPGGATAQRGWLGTAGRSPSLAAQPCSSCQKAAFEAGRGGVCVSVHVAVWLCTLPARLHGQAVERVKEKQSGAARKDGLRKWASPRLQRCSPVVCALFLGMYRNRKSSSE